MNTMTKTSLSLANVQNILSQLPEELKADAQRRLVQRVAAPCFF